jgi:hypothetical protein
MVLCMNNNINNIIGERTEDAGDDVVELVWDERLAGVAQELEEEASHLARVGNSAQVEDSGWKRLGSVVRNTVNFDL